MSNAIIVFVFILACPRLFEFLQDVISTSSHNRAARKFGKQWMEESSGLAGSLAYYEEQEQIVCDLLRQAYSMNILPQPYRNLSAVHYIYTYMASSQETLSDTLLHAHIERGIQQISSRIDHLTSQCNQLISQSRSMSQQLSYVQNQNAQLMNYCNRVNTYLLTARYLHY